MKLSIALFSFSLISTSVFAHPGGNQLVCRSVKNTTSTQKTEISITRSNGIGWFSPTIEVKINNKVFKLSTPDEMNNYGTTFHNSPLKVITVTAEVPFEENINSGYATIVAMPETVKPFNIDGNPAIWNMEAEKDECNDTNGKATFKGIFHGSFFEGQTQINVDTQIMDCELTYNSGMSC